MELENKNVEKKVPVQLIMLTFNGLDYIKQTVASLYDYTDHPFELTIVDNASDEKTKTWLKKAIDIYPNMSIIFNDTNLGFSGGNNVGLRSIVNKKWDFVGLINSDLILTKGWLGQLLESWNAAKKYIHKPGMIGPVSANAGGVQGVQATYKSIDDLQDFAVKFHIARLGNVQEAFMLVGFCLLIHRDYFEDVGYLDERFQAMWEDNDYALRGRLRGWHCVVDNSTYIHHWMSKSFKENNIDSRKRFFEGKEIYLQKWQTVGKKTLCAMMRVKNGEKYIKRTLEKLSEMCDYIVVLVDQHTTDNTYNIARQFSKVVRLGKEPAHEYSEAYSRNMILKWAKETNCDWIWCSDHDEVPEDKLIKNIQYLMNPEDPMTFLYVFQMIQLWNSEETFRKDGLWGYFMQGRLFRNLPDQEISNLNDLIHCGSHPHFPIGNVKNTFFRIIHYGNVEPEYRQKKYTWYSTTDTDLDINMVLGGYREFYWKLYYGDPTPGEQPDWRILKENGVGIPRYGNFWQRDAYRHIVDEKSLQLGKFTQDISVTLCMIAKDEGTCIAGALESVKDIVDDIVVVDTGSSDNTKAIAKAYGARVYEYTGRRRKDGRLEDFSDARNLSIRKASTKWILRVDPDEVVPIQMLPLLSLMMQDDNIDAYMFQIKNFLEDPRTNPYAQWVLSETCRLFKNTPDIYYSGCVHEEIDDALKLLSNKRSIRVEKTDATLHHFGYLRGQEYLNTKFEHYCDLNTKQIQQLPNDFRSYFSRAVHYFHTNEWDKAIADYNKTLELQPDHWMAYNDLAVIYQHRGNYEKAIQYFKKAQSLISPDVNQIHRQKVAQNLEQISKEFSTKLRSMVIS